jgi:hypothetical protein
MESPIEKVAVNQLEEEEVPPTKREYVDDPEAEARILKKLDWHILPWIFILWLLAFIDRSNIGEFIHQHLQEAIT